MKTFNAVIPDFCAGEIVAISWLIQAHGGVDRQTARVIQELQQSIELDSVDGLPASKWAEKVDMKEISSLSMQWLRDEIDKMFGLSKIPPQLATYVLSLDDKMTEMIKRE